MKRASPFVTRSTLAGVIEGYPSALAPVMDGESFFR